MKVVCINNNWVPSPQALNNPKPGIGDEFTVKNEVFVQMFNGSFYEFFEHPDCFYHKSMFVELPDTPAEVIEEKETVTA